MAEATFERLKVAVSDRYAIRRELGCGGMATVYLASDLKHDRKVAIKVMRPELSSILGSDRFLREISIAAKLNHPHIVPLYDSGVADGILFYVMPQIEGESLRDRLTRERQLPIETALQITREVAAALSYAHSHGIVHRDIKPENVLLSAGEAVVADFGIARAITAAGGEGLTETGMALGTPAYMSPEQATADEVDGRSDIYSLGCVLYEMLSGEAPYLGSTPKAVMARKLAEPVPSVRTLRDTVPHGLDVATRKALARTPADRFQTAAEFGDSLATATDAAEERPTAKRRFSLAAKLFLALLVLDAIVLGGWWASGKIFGNGGAIERMVVLPPENFMGDSTQDFFLDGIHDELIAKLSSITGLVVLSRTTAARYKGTDKTAQEIAGELSVDALLESSVLLYGDSIRIQVQLIDPFPQERHLWQDTYDRQYSNFFALNSDVALAVAEQIQITLTPAEQVELSDARVVNQEAHEAVLRAKYLLNTFGVAEASQAISLLEHAIALDSGYAEAYAWLARAYDQRGLWFGDLTPTVAYPIALNAATKALELDNEHALAYSALGDIRSRFLWDWQGAETVYRQALDIDPGSADTHGTYANYLRAMGRYDESVVHIERAMELDPLTAMRFAEASMHYRDLNNPERAEELINRALELQPEFPPAYWVLAQRYVEDGDPITAIEMLEHEGVPGFPGADGFRATLYAVTGSETRARLLVDSVMQRPKPELLMVACAYVALGEDGLALTMLERAYRERDPMMVWLGNISRRSWNVLYRLRNEPRFLALMEQLDFPPSATQEL